VHPNCAKIPKRDRLGLPVENDNQLPEPEVIHSPHTIVIVFPIGGAIALFRQGVISVSPAFNSSLTSQAPLESYDLDGVEDS
jgi:hypothetical protein